MVPSADRGTQSRLRPLGRRTSDRQQDIAVEQPLLSEIVADKIFDLIIQGELEPGERCRTEWLADLLGVSRSPVRDALRELASDGLVIAEPRRGTVVAGVTAEETVQFYDCRKLLQGESVRLATAELTAADLDRLTDIHKAMEDAVQDATAVGYLHLVDEFQQVVLDACRNTVLTDLIGSLWRRSARFRAISIRSRERMIESCTIHAELLRALQNEEIEEAVAATDALLDRSREAILEALENRD